MTAEIVVNKLSKHLLIGGREVSRMLIEKPEELQQVEGVVRQVLDNLGLAIEVTDGYATLVRFPVPNELKVNNVIVGNDGDRTSIIMTSRGSSVTAGTRVDNTPYKVEVIHR